MVILTAIAKVLMGLFVIALVLAFITAIFLLGAIVATLGTATHPLFGRDQEDDEPEMVNHPDHYNRPGQKECIVEMEEKFGTKYVQHFLPVEPLQILIPLRAERRHNAGIVKKPTGIEISFFRWAVTVIC